MEDGFLAFGLDLAVALHGAEAIGLGRCEVCGAPATYLSRDVIRVADVDHEAYKLGAPHRGCAAHPDLAFDQSKGGL